MNLFITQDFIAHSGQKEKFKIECDALSMEDIETLTMIINDKFCKMDIKFSEVYGIPNGGIRIAEAFKKYLDESASYVLILDDVQTTGRSMNDYIDFIKDKTDKPILGCVLFDRSKGNGLEWVHNIFRM